MKVKALKTIFGFIFLTTLVSQCIVECRGLDRNIYELFPDGIHIFQQSSIKSTFSKSFFLELIKRQPNREIFKMLVQILNDKSQQWSTQSEKFMLRNFIKINSKDKVKINEDQSAQEDESLGTFLRFGRRQIN